MSIHLTELLDVFVHLPQAAAVYDSKDLNIAFVNAEMLHIWNRTDDLIGREFGEIFPEHIKQGFDGLLRDVWLTGETYNAHETRADILVDGVLTPRYFDFEYKAIKGSDGKVKAILHTATEVSERMRSRKLVEEREENVAKLNKELHATNEELLATTEKLSSTVDQLLQSHKQLAASESQIRQIMDSAPTGLGVVGVKNLTIESANAHFLAMVGADVNAIGKPFAEVLSPENQERLKKLVNEVLEKGKSHTRTDVQTPFFTSEGVETRYHNIVYQPVFDSIGEIFWVLIVASDVTSQHNAKTELETAYHSLQERDSDLRQANENLEAAYREISASEERLNLAINSASIGTWRFDMKTMQVAWDDRTRDLYGFTSDDVVSYADVLQHIHELDRPKVELSIEQALSTRARADYDVKFRTVVENGDTFRWIHAKGKAYFDEYETPTVLSGIVLDITQTMLAQQRISVFHELVAQKEKKLQMIVDSAKVGTYVFNQATKEIQLNDHSRKLFGFTDDELLTEGSPIEQTVADFIPMAVEAMESAIANNTAYDYSYQIVDKRSGAVKWLRSVGSSAGITSPNMFYGVIIDITAQKQEEKRKTDFLGIASHELRSPLTALTGYLQILEHKSDSVNKQQLITIVKNAERQTARMRSLIDGFLDISNIEDGNLRLRLDQVHVADLARDIRSTFTDTVKSHQFDLSGVDRRVSVLLDRHKIEQVITNFVHNAIKYTPSGTRISITAKMESNHWVVKVKDEGPGISAKDQENLFEKFYRVPREGRSKISGFGIGLYISKEIVRLHGGEIGVVSQDGLGATFWFSIPQTNLTTSGISKLN